VLRESHNIWNLGEKVKKKCPPRKVVQKLSRFPKKNVYPRKKKNKLTGRKTGTPGEDTGNPNRNKGSSGEFQREEKGGLPFFARGKELYCSPTYFSEKGNCLKAWLGFSGGSLSVGEEKNCFLLER